MNKKFRHNKIGIRTTEYGRREKGQIAIFVALMFTLLFLFMSMAVNTAQIVSYKIKLQNIADMASYAGATVMARYMTDGVEDFQERSFRDQNLDLTTFETARAGSDKITISELNKAIMINYLSLLQRVVTMQCSTDSSDITPNCRSGCDTGKNIARTNYGTRVDEYVEQTELMIEEILEISEEMRKRAKNTAMQTIAASLKHLEDYEVYVKISPIEFETEEVDVFGSTYEANWDMFSGCSVNSATSGNARNYCLGFGETIPRRQIYKIQEGNGYAIVGIVKKQNKSSVDYINWTKTFGTKKSPLFQVWSAAAPIRDISESKFMDDTVKDLFKVVRKGSYWSTTSNSNADVGAHQSHFTYIFEQSHSGTKMVKEIIEGNGGGSEGINLIGESAQAFEDSADPLFRTDPPMRVRYIPLAGDQFNYEEAGFNYNYYGSANPIQGDLSKAIFGYVLGNRADMHLSATEGRYIRKKLNRTGAGQGAAYAYKIFGH